MMAQGCGNVLLARIGDNESLSLCEIVDHMSFVICVGDFWSRVIIFFYLYAVEGS